MNLIEIKGDKSLDVYSLEIIKSKVSEYKKRVLRERGVCFASLQTNDKRALDIFQTEDVMELDKISFARKLSSSTDVFSNFKKIERDFYELSDSENAIVTAYIENLFGYISPQKIVSDIESIYFLGTTDKILYRHSSFGTYYQTQNNLMLPQELYLLGLIEADKGHTEETRAFIGRHKDFFKFSYLRNFPDFEALFNLGIIDIDTYDKILARSNTEKTLIKRLKKDKA